MEEGAADSDGVRIVYHTAGEGPLVVFVHSITGPWFDWRHQLVGLSEHYRVVAMSTRGTDRSDKPEGVEHYTMAKISSDIAAIIDPLRRGARHHRRTGQRRVLRLALRHDPPGEDRAPRLGRHDPSGRSHSGARFERGAAAGQHVPAGHAGEPERGGGVRRADAEPAAEPGRYLRAGGAAPAGVPAPLPGVDRELLPGQLAASPVHDGDRRASASASASSRRSQAPTLLIYGKESGPFKPETLTGIWDWVDGPLTLRILPGVGHGPHTQVPETVTPAILQWLGGRVARHAFPVASSGPGALRLPIPPRVFHRFLGSAPRTPSFDAVEAGSAPKRLVCSAFRPISPAP